MFNITNRVARARYQVQMTRKMMLLERYQTKQLRSILGRQYLEAAKLVEQGVDDLGYVVDAQRDRMKSVIAKHYKRTASVFGKDVFNAFGKLKGIGQPTYMKTMKDEYDLSMRQWTVWQTAKQVQDVGITTKKNLKGIFNRGVANGLSNREIAKEIRSKSRITNPIRAARIARTETHSGAVKSVNTAVASTHVKMEREWDAAQDERVREDHAIADGQRRDQETPYDVGGEPLMYPGDPSGSAKNVINCRCVELFHVIREGIKQYILRRRNRLIFEPIK